MSDEDDLDEHYFLQPVKGYNIVDKIKLANEELYEIEFPMHKMKKPKVSFRENLVDYEPEYSSDDGYGESGTSASDHELKNTEKECDEEIPEECDLDKELEKLRCCNVKEKPTISSDSDEPEEEEEEEDIEEAVDDNEIPDESECGCESDTEQSDDDDQYGDDHYEDDCCTNNKKESSCSECQMVEKLVAELVVKQVNDAEKTPPAPPPPKKKKLFKSRFGRNQRNNGDTTFEVIETEHGRFRGCCRHKVEHVEKILPQYQGAVSLYGLSEEQYEKREKSMEKIEKVQMEKMEKLKEDYKKKVETNEDAFSQWMKNKTKTPANNTKNMYDTKIFKRKPTPRRQTLMQKRGPANTKKTRTNEERKPGT